MMNPALKKKSNAKLTSGEAVRAERHVRHETAKTNLKQAYQDIGQYQTQRVP
jgi:hypothetical protein